MHQPLQSGKMQYAIVDDNVEDAPIYRCEGKAPKPTRPRENHGLAMECVPTQSESCQKPQSKSFAVPAQGIIGKTFQNPGDAGMYIITMADLGLTSQIAQQIGPNRSEERQTIAD